MSDFNVAFQRFWAEHPIVDETMETARLKAADLFFKFQDAVEQSLGAKASDYLDALLPYCLDIQQQVQLINQQLVGQQLGQQVII